MLQHCFERNILNAATRMKLGQYGTVNRTKVAKRKNGMKLRRGLTLVEILTVLTITTVLMSITVPAVSKVRRQARTLKGMNNIRQIVLGVNIYAMDNDSSYPASVATLTDDDGSWQWEDPRMMCACKQRTSKYHRSMSAYLKEYFPDADILTCPSAPSQYKQLQEAWDAGDDWDLSTSSYEADSLYGSYVFLWNYRAYKTETENVFHGPQSQDGRRQSEILVADYFGYNHYRSPRAFSSCEYIKPPGIAMGTDVSSDFWTVELSARNIARFDRAKLRSGMVDGSVATYNPLDTRSFEVSTEPDGSVPYPSALGTGPGQFYIPQ